MAINKKTIKTILGLCLFFCINNTQAQFFKDIFKYSTFYAAYSQSNSIQDSRSFYVDQDNTLHETTKEVPADFIMTYGWRKLANFQYEDRNKFYIGEENNAGTRSNIGNVKGLEYLFQYSKGKNRGADFENQEAFIRYLAKWWLIKGEYQKNELVDLDYKSAEVRARFAIGKKLSLSIGAIWRTYDTAYGFNPIETYLEDNMWWNLAYDYAEHTDQLYQMVDPFTGQSLGYDYQWFDANGNLLSNSDLDYRNNVFQDVVNNYNKEQLSMISGFQQVSLISGLDFYHYRDKFWLHIYGNVLPYHYLLKGDKEYSYGNFVGDYLDFSAGAVLGLKITQKIGLYGEINLQRYWDREIRSIKAGVNIKI